MIIDFHTHAFPDALAPRALESLVSGIDRLYTPSTDATVRGILSDMDESGVDISVLQPVITKPSQVIKTNEWARSVCSGRIVSFGGIYPHTDDYKRDIDYVCSLGLKGLKFHPEYQDFVVDSDEMLPIYDYALSKGLILLFHAGFDPCYQPPYRSSPRQFARLADEMKGGVMVAAHLGGQEQWDDVEAYLAGKNIYLDTSMGFQYYPQQQFLRIAEKHGTDKILFGTDSPWSVVKDELAALKALPLTEEEKDMILGRNARRLLFGGIS